MVVMADPVLPEGYSIEDLADDDLAPKGAPDHDCDGTGGEDG